MASERQIAANRLNAKHSSGPKTDKGKARSSQNAITHGLTVQSGLQRWARLFGQIFRFDKWNICQGLGRQADRRQALCCVVGLIGRHAVKA